LLNGEARFLQRLHKPLKHADLPRPLRMLLTRPDLTTNAKHLRTRLINRTLKSPSPLPRLTLSPVPSKRMKPLTKPQPKAKPTTKPLMTMLGPRPRSKKLMLKALRPKKLSSQTRSMLLRRNLKFSNSKRRPKTRLLLPLERRDKLSSRSSSSRTKEWPSSPEKKKPPSTSRMVRKARRPVLPARSLLVLKLPSPKTLRELLVTRRRLSTLSPRSPLQPPRSSPSERRSPSSRLS